MRIVAKDQDKLEQERKLAQIRLDEEEARKEYMAKMRGNKYFQKFIIEGIIKKRIDEVLDLTKIPNGDYEEMGKLLFQAKAVKAKLEQMLSDIVNG